MTRVVRAVAVVVAPVITGTESLPAAATVAGWFHARMQVVVTDPTLRPAVSDVLATLRVDADTVDVVESADLAGHVRWVSEAQGPAMVVLPRPLPSDAATEPGIPHLLVGPHGRRLPTGPLVLACTEGSGVATALAAVWARALDLDVHTIGPGASTAAEVLVAMGVEAAEEAGTHDLAAAGALAERLDATALVVAGRPRDLDLAEIPASVPVLSAGSATTTAPAAPGPPSGATIEALTERESLDLLRATRFGRLAYLDGGRPTIVPVNYRVHGGDVVIRSLAGAKLAAADRRSTVCLEIDELTAEGDGGWSVVVHGPIEVVEDAHVLAEVWGEPGPSLLDGVAMEWLRLVPTAVGGRRIVPGRSGSR